VARVTIVNPYEEALNRFDQLIQTAKKTELGVPLSMTLATVDEQARPSVRLVAVKNYDRRGFVFFTHQRSRKGVQIAGNPHVALCLFCPPLMEQVTIEGVVELVKDDEADAYWATRARDGQFAAWASNQSEPLESRATLQDRLAEFQKQYADQRVPRPSTWVGYRVVPNRIEFWRAGWRHLHERICYNKIDNNWERMLLNP
jgi:pyridoxamine 5'-phosphate oxidase